MAEIKYQGLFTMQNNGVDVPAMLIITTANLRPAEVKEFSTYRKLRLAEDPVVITWDDVELTDVIHPSQMAVSLKAANEADYRDILDCSGDVNGGLYHYDSLQKQWLCDWIGKKADMTWEEPFVRGSGYPVSITFSDFGYLSRKSVSFTLPGGYIKVWDLLRKLIQELHPYADLFSRSYDLKVNNTYFLYSYIRSVVTLTPDQSDARKVTDVIESILSPANIHIAQRAGSFDIYRPAKDMLSGPPVMLRGLKPAGVDATLAAADSYGSIRLAYLQKHDLELINPEKLSVSSAGYEGPWRYASDGTDSQDYFIVSDKRYSSSKIEGYLSNYIDGSKVVPCIYLASAGDWNTPTTHQIPQITPYPTDQDIPDINLKIEVGNNNRRRLNFYPSSGSGKIELVLPTWLDINTYSGNEIWPPTIEFEAMFIPYNIPAAAIKKKYLRATTTGVSAENKWVDTKTELYPPYLRWTPKGTTGSDRFYRGGIWQKFFSLFPVPDGAGQIVVKVKPNTIFIDGTQSGTAIDVMTYAVRLPEMNILSEYNSDLISQANVIEEDLDNGSIYCEAFEKEFEYGTPVLETSATLTNFVDSAGVGTVKDGARLIDHYARFMETNYSVDGYYYRRRWKVRGSFKYDHLSYFPLFMAGQNPALKVIADDRYALIPRNEEWHVRRGLSILELEEIYIK